MPRFETTAPEDAKPGEPTTEHLTQFFLELTDDWARWFRTGRWIEDGHPTAAEAWQEWDDRADRDKYTGRRVVRIDWTCTATVEP